jgi:hypothetical protein
MIIQYRVEGFTAKSKKSNKYKEGVPPDTATVPASKSKKSNKYKEGEVVSPEQERIAKTVLYAVFKVHSCLGPGYQQFRFRENSRFDIVLTALF